MDEIPMVPLSAALVTLGCRVNRSENEALSRALGEAGIPLAELGRAELVIVNTCCVTGEAQAKTRKVLRRLAAHSMVRKVVAYGCAAALFGPELEALSPKIVVVSDRDAVVEAVRFSAERPAEIPAAEGCEGAAPGAPDRSRPSLKVQDGCDRRCSYCIVWKARGPARSLDAERVVREVDGLARQGFGEVVLCGVNLGTYASGGLDLAGLLDLILERTDVGRLRLSSIEPQDVTDALLELMAASGGRIAPYLAMPLQSGCDATLARMDRLYTAKDYRERVRAARALMPDVAVAADLICGFPGETEGDWFESMVFCYETGLASLHVFRYSARPGTVAAGLPDQVPPLVAKRRSAEARRLRDELRRRYAASLVGTTQRVLVEVPGWGVTGGLVHAKVDESLPRSALVDLPAKGRFGSDALDCRP